MYLARSMRGPAVHEVLRRAWVHLSCMGTRVMDEAVCSAWGDAHSLPGHSSVQDIQALIAIEE